MEPGPALRDPRERVSLRARNLWHLTACLEGLLPARSWSSRWSRSRRST